MILVDRSSPLNAAWIVAVSNEPGPHQFAGLRIERPVHAALLSDPSDDTRVPPAAHAEHIHARPREVPHTEVVLPWRAPRRCRISAAESTGIGTCAAKRPSQLACLQVEGDH